MAVMNRDQYVNELDKSIDRVLMREYQDLPKLYTQKNIFKMGNAPAGKSYTESEITGVGSFREIPEGTGFEFDSPEEGHKKTVTYSKYGLGLQITEETFEDSVHRNIEKVPATLALSARNKQETDAWSLFNLAASETAWDGKAIVADDHTTLKSGDTIDNKTTSSLSETSMQAGFEHFWKLKTEEGFYLQLVPDLLIIPTELTWLANRLYRQMVGVASLNTSGDTSDVWASQEGQIMTVNPTHGIVPQWSPFPVVYLTDATNWFLVNTSKLDFRIYWKRRLQTEAGDDFRTGNRLYKAVMRYGVFAMDYKAIYGGIVAG